MLKKDTDIIHVAMGGGVKKVFTYVGGVQKVLAACEGGSKKFDDKNFQLPSPSPPKYLWTLPKALKSQDMCKARGGALGYIGVHMREQKKT